MKGYHIQGAAGREIRRKRRARYRSQFLVLGHFAGRYLFGPSATPHPPTPTLVLYSSSFSAARTLLGETARQHARQPGWYTNTML